MRALIPAYSKAMAHIGREQKEREREERNWLELYFMGMDVHLKVGASRIEKERKKIILSNG